MFTDARWRLHTVQGMYQLDLSLPPPPLPRRLEIGVPGGTNTCEIVGNALLISFISYPHFTRFPISSCKNMGCRVEIGTKFYCTRLGGMLSYGFYYNHIGNAKLLVHIQYK